MTPTTDQREAEIREDHSYSTVIDGTCDVCYLIKRLDIERAEVKRLKEITEKIRADEKQRTLDEVWKLATEEKQISVLRGVEYIEIEDDFKMGRGLRKIISSLRNKQPEDKQP